MNTTFSLSNSEIQEYDTLGFYKVSGLYTDAELDEIEIFFEELKRIGSQTFERGNGYREEDKTKHQIRAMHPHRHSHRVMEWFLKPEVVQILGALLRTPPLGAQTMYYYKPPGARGQGMHQDNFYLLASPATCIGAWTAIDSADEENGCLWVVPRSHGNGIYCPEAGKNRWLEYGDSHISSFPRETKPVPVPVQRGETLFFAGDLIHGSGPNRSKTRSRRTFIGHYISEASESVSSAYHPIVDQHGNIVSTVKSTPLGGPCGDGWMGAIH